MMEHTMIIVITYNFISLKTSFFYDIINPTCPRYILHVLHGNPSGTHLFILHLKALRDSDSFISLGIKSQIFGPTIIHKIFETNSSFHVK